MTATLETTTTKGATVTPSPRLRLPSPIGEITIRPLDLGLDADRLHAWVTTPRARYWQMEGWSAEQVREAYAQIDARDDHDAWVGEVDGRPTFLVETYDPAGSELADLPEIARGDLGMHVLVAPAEHPVPGTTTEVMRAVMELCVGPLGALRVVVEPDVRNDAIHAKNALAGIRVQRAVPLAGKTALLGVVTAHEYRTSELGRRTLLAHLRPDVAERAHRHVAAKALGELTHEHLITPEVVEEVGGLEARAQGARRTSTSDQRYVVTTPSGARWSFAATRHALEHWRVDPASVEHDSGPVDAQLLLSQLAPVLGIPEHLRSVYLEEIASTIASLCHKWTHQRRTSAELVDADFQDVEQAMSEGHPAFVANNGRIGFGVLDHARYAPESGAPVRLEWLAARRSLTHLALGGDLTEERLYREELGEGVIEGFRAHLAALGEDPDDYVWLPVHPWQMEHKIAVTFAPDLARHDLVHLGSGEQHYRAQQSIRTFYPMERESRYVKTACAIQNMGFLRGLSPAYMRVTPAINEWVLDTLDGDPVLASCGFTVLPEVASIGYTGDAYHQLGTRTAHTKMVAALWRDHPAPLLAPGERLATLAGTLHRDRDGVSLLGEWIRASTVDPEQWVRALLRAYVRPVVHCLRVHRMAFMPHSENLVLVLAPDHVPARAIMKDIGEEVAYLGSGPLPEEVERVRMADDVELTAQSFFTDVMDGVLRYVAEILADDGLLDGEDFWALVRACVAETVRDGGPVAADLALDRATFAHSCLNRLQLRNTLQMVDLADQATSLTYVGELVNPIADA
ncbi:GNAT family N-acetyltransferase [Janibacter melonis]|uniref:GNAT family N-acetyltransferase n=1 Tax=Janibacter melonis TaxID=262209 RepID=UPI00174E480C|nr:GNAT family N-acetyltransferase [Janibacter melonis]